MKNSYIRLRVNADEKAQLKLKAQKQGLPMSELVRKSIGLKK